MTAPGAERALGAIVQTFGIEVEDRLFFFSLVILLLRQTRITLPTTNDWLNRMSASVQQAEKSWDNLHNFVSLSDRSRQRRI
jgi:hypothetical protein